MSNALILAIESACTGCSVAVARGEEIITYRADSTPSRQAAALVPMIGEAMREAGINYKDLQQLAVTVGPGSFTGIRIGISTARAIGFASGVTVRGVTTLAAMAAAEYQKSNGNRILAILNAGKGEVYAQVFESMMQPVASPNIYSPADAEALGGIIIRNLPDASAVAWLAARNLLLQPPIPFYIRPPDAKPANLKM